MRGAGWGKIEMAGIITWIGSRTCDAFLAVGAEQLIARACSSSNGLYGLGLITCVVVALVAGCVFLIWGR
jgi:hypothetical protein